MRQSKDDMKGSARDGGGTSLPMEDPVLRVVPMPADSNPHGDVFGGWIMSQVDIAGGILASRRANGRVATVAVTSFAFKEPVFVGDLISIFGKVVRTGRTSITIDMSVYAERNRLKVEVVKVTEATLVFVATDEHRRPRDLPQLGT
jgi:acyl-CoA thioesterase YciA